MSWSVNARGTKEAVKAMATEQFDAIAKNYAGKPEGDDVAMCKARALALVDAIDLESDGYYKGKEIVVSANGSHSWQVDASKPSSCSFSLTVARTIE